MAGVKYYKLFFVLGVFVTVINSDSDEGNLMSYEELYERQKQAFVDSLGYGDTDEDVNNRLEEPNELKKDNEIHSEDTNRKTKVRKRSASGSDPYGLIAGISGGSVIHTGKDNISSAVDILTTSTLSNPVILTRKSLTFNGSSQIDFDVDKSLTKLALEVQSLCCRPKIMITDAKGNNLTASSPNVTVKVAIATMTYVQIFGSFNPGTWFLTISAASRQGYDVTVWGSSLINFDLSHSDNGGNTVSGQPIPDSNSTYVKVTLSGADLVSNWTYLLIKSINGTLVQTLPLGTMRGSRTSKAFLLPVVWPNMDVHVGVQGLDQDGNIFTREQRTLVQPLGVRLLLNDAGADFINSCNTPFIIPFTVTNTGSTGDFTLQVTSDNRNFLATVSPKSVSLASKGTTRGQASVTLKTTPTSDKTVQILIAVLDSLSKAQYVTKTLIAKDVKCPDTVTYTYVETSGTSNKSINSSITPSTISNDAPASGMTVVNMVPFLITLLLSLLPK